MAVKLTKTNTSNNPWRNNNFKASVKSTEYTPSEKDMLEKYPDGTNVYSAPGVLTPRTPRENNEKEIYPSVKSDITAVECIPSTAEHTKSKEKSAPITDGESISFILLIILGIAAVISFIWLFVSGGLPDIFSSINLRETFDFLPPFLLDALSNVIPLLLIFPVFAFGIKAIIRLFRG